MQITPKAGRKHHIDLLKAFAIFSVVLYHLTTYQCDILETGSFGDYFRYLSRPLLSACVPLFFLINGYLVLNKPLDLRSHVNRMLKLVLLTFLWGVIGLFAYMGITGAELTVGDFFWNLWHWLPNKWINHLWYMGALVCIYVFLPLIKYVFDHARNIFNYLMIIAGIFTFGDRIINDIITIFGNLWFDTDFLLNENTLNFFNPFRGIYGYSFVYFCFGGHIAGREEKLRALPARTRNISALIGLIINSFLLWGQGIYYSNISGNVWDIVWNGYDSVFTFSIAFCLYVLSLNYNTGIPIIQKIASNTLGIYFMHNIPVQLIRLSLSENLLLGTSVLGNSIAALSIIAYCLALCIVIKKSDLWRWLIT